MTKLSSFNTLVGETIAPMKFVHKIITFSLISELSIVSLCAKATHAQTNIQQVAAKTCAVMAGQKKLDQQTLQYLQILDEDLADANPVAIALYREVLNQCPKAYVNFQQRKRVNNPFPPGSLINPNPASLVNPNPSPLIP